MIETLRRVMVAAPQPEPREEARSHPEEGDRGDKLATSYQSEIDRLTALAII